MENINKVVDGLSRLNQVVGMDGKWVNLFEFQRELQRLPVLLENAIAARDQMTDLMDPDHPDQQRALNYEHEQEMEGMRV